MKQLVMISGKGGTGKTIILASFAALTPNKITVDCDVDAANLHLLLHPQIQERHLFSGGKKAVIDPEKCTRCGECISACRFEAIKETEKDEITVDRISCEGCAVCSLICPADAIKMQEEISGEWFVSQTRYGPFVHAKLGIGEENSGKLVTEVRKKAREIAEKDNLGFVLIDGPPGIGCPVISSLSGTDTALVVTEPTLSGIHDMERVIQTARHFRIQTACCINKYDLNLENTTQIEKWCRGNSVPLLGKIPFDEEVPKSMVQLTPFIEYSKNPASEEIKKIWQKLQKQLDTKEMKK